MGMERECEEGRNRFIEYLNTKPDILTFAKEMFHWEPFDYQAKAITDTSKKKIYRWGRQCLEENEYVYTPTGVTQCKDLFEGKEIIGGNISGLHKFKDEIYEITFSTGVKIRCNNEHPFFTKHGWKKLKDIKHGEHIQFIESDSKYTTKNNTGKLLGYLLSDGYWNDGQSIKFTNNNTRFIEEVGVLARMKFNIETKIRNKGNGFDIHLVQKHGTNRENPLASYLKKIGIWNKESFGEIPFWSNDDLIDFIKGYFNGDGYLSIYENRHNRKDRIEIGLSIGCSKRRAIDMQYILWKLGIFSYVKSEIMGKNIFHRIMINGDYDNISKMLSILEDTKYPNKFAKARNSIKHPIVYKKTRKYINNNWIAIKNIKPVGRGYVIGWDTVGFNEIISYCGMRTHNTGKSTVSAIEGLYAAMTRPKITVLIISPVQRQSGLLFRKIKNLITELSQKHPEFTDDNSFKYVIRETATVIEFANGSEIHSLPAGDDASSLRGFTAHFIILDEVARIKDEVFVALKPMFATTWKDSQWLMISTPKGVKNYFYEACTKSIYGYREYFARSKDSPLITEDFLASEREGMTLNEYLQEYEGEFVSEADTFFTLDEIRDIMIKECPTKTEPDKGFEYYLGFDPAMLGEDEAVGVIIERRPEHLVKAGAKEFAVVNYIVKGKSSIAEQIGLLRNLNRVWHFKRMVVDRTGFGEEFMIDLSKELGMNVEGIFFTTKSIEDLYLNAKRFFEVRAFIMPVNIKMKQQLNEMKYEYRRYDGRLNVFNPNKKAKTDYPTALVLALWGTKKTVHKVVIVTARGIYNENTS